MGVSGGSYSPVRENPKRCFMRSGRCVVRKPDDCRARGKRSALSCQHNETFASVKTLLHLPNRRLRNLSVWRKRAWQRGDALLWRWLAGARRKPLMPCWSVLPTVTGSRGSSSTSSGEMSATCHPSKRLVAAPWVEKLHTFRITLTPPVLCHAAHVVFAAGGADKAETLQSVLHGPYQPDLYPSQVVKPTPGALRWLVDKAAARLLS